jgi:hypothetical protein
MPLSTEAVKMPHVEWDSESEKSSRMGADKGKGTKSSRRCSTSVSVLMPIDGDCDKRAELSLQQRGPIGPIPSGC